MKKPILVKFGLRVRSLRNVRDLTQKELGAITGFHHNYIGMIERGDRNPRLENLEVFANAFDMSLSELFILEVTHED